MRKINAAKTLLVRRVIFILIPIYSTVVWTWRIKGTNRLRRGLLRLVRVFRRWRVLSRRGKAKERKTFRSLSKHVNSLFMGLGTFIVSDLNHF